MGYLKEGSIETIKIPDLKEMTGKDELQWLAFVGEIYNDGYKNGYRAGLDSSDNWYLYEYNKPEESPNHYLITVLKYDEHMKPIGVSTECALYVNGTWIGRDDKDVIAWQEMPDPYPYEESN